MWSINMAASAISFSVLPVIPLLVYTLTSFNSLSSRDSFHPVPFCRHRKKYVQLIFLYYLINTINHSVQNVNPGLCTNLLFIVHIVTVQTRHSQNCACGALRRFATIFAHDLALNTTLDVSAKSCEHDLCAYVQGCLNCYCTSGICYKRDYH